MTTDGSKKVKTFFKAVSCQEGFDVSRSKLETFFDNSWDEYYCIPTQLREKVVAHFSSNGEIMFFGITENEQKQVLDFVKTRVLC